MLRLIAALVVLVAIALPAVAQTGGPRTVLVLDASGSMWGQIDGENKIVIARRAMGELLDSLPDDQQLGLVAYGHRRKGDCGDIESLVEPGPGTREAIRGAVNSVSPKGKTPLSAAVLEAAERLKYTEDAATVILVSDGRETCEMDPCAVGERLEQTGVDFTAHVIGFDVSADDQAGLSCLAERTGGQFLAAANATELSDALMQISAPPPPVDVTLRAVIAETGEVIDEGLVWTLSPAPTGEAVLADEMQPQPRASLDGGRYIADVLWIVTEDGASKEFEVSAGSEPMTVTLELSAPIPDAAVMGPPTAEAGTPVDVGWEGPGDPRDYITVARPEAEPGNYENYTYLESGNPLSLTMPGEPGVYELRYIQREGTRILATAPITVEEVAASLTAPPTAPAGEPIDVGWTGPDQDKDFITVSKPGSQGGQYENYAYTGAGNPVALTMPGTPGSYELRYIQREGMRILASVPITVEEVGAAITAPPTAPAGAPLNVEWTGPDQDKDYITVAKPGAQGGQYENYTYTSEGSPLQLTMPGAPGDYELRYIQREGTRILASVPITVEGVESSLTAPPTAPAGAPLSVEWTGPDQDKDFITVSKPGSQGGQYENFTYTREGSPLELTMPGAPGSYELRYIQREGMRILASVPITVDEVGATVTAPPTAPVGASLSVEWTGPDQDKDYITVAKPGAQGGQYENYTYTREGSPLQLTMPGAPGDYELRYIQSEGARILASVPITVEEVTASVSGPPAADAGAQIDVEWTGPDQDKDYITVAKPVAQAGQYESYTYTREGSPLTLTLPGAPGEYELRYILREGPRVLASVPISVTEVTASVSAPPGAITGAAVSVEWTGPDQEKDYIALARPDHKDTQYESYVYTREGAPLEVTMPAAPGSYEIRYVQRQGGRVLARTPIEVSAATARLAIPPSAAPGGQLQVIWEGPGQPRDTIVIAEAGAADDRSVARAPVDQGSPLVLTLPDAPGAYEVRYIQRVGGNVLARQPLMLE